MGVSGWILSIVGVVVLGVAFDTLSPEGEMQRFIRGVFALVTLFVIIAPMPALLNKQFDFSLNAPIYQDDTAYTEAVYKARVKLLESAAESAAADSGWEGLKATITVDCYNENMRITLVTLNTQNLVIAATNGHIFSYEEIEAKVAAALGISRAIIIKV